MRNTKFLLVVLISFTLLPFSLIAQKKQADKPKDVVITNSNDTVVGKVNLSIPVLLFNPYYRSVRYKDSKGNLTVYKASDIKCFWEGSVFWRSAKVKGRKNKVFLNMITYGKIEYLQNPGHGRSRAKFFICKDHNDTFIQVTKGNFKKTMEQYFYDCPAFKEGIKGQKTNYYQFEELVKLYNKNCK